MARDSSVPNWKSATTDDGGSKSKLDRRSYLKLAGGTTAVATLTGSVNGANDGYESIEARGQTVRVGRGETYENKLIDLTTGGNFLLYIEGANSVVRNIGFKGLYRGDSFQISIRAGSGDVLVENVYLGDGATKEGEDFVHGPGAVFMHRDNDADVTFRNCNVQGYPNNGFYCSNTPYGGSVCFESCFGKNNGVATFRCGSADDEIVNCVAYNDNTDYGSGHGGYVEENGRPVWVWNGGTVTIRDSHFADGPYPYAIVAGANGSPGRIDFRSGGVRGEIRRGNGSTVSVRNAVSKSPDLSIPNGVPTSAEEAAAGTNTASDSGNNADGDDRSLPNIVIFDGRGTTEPTRYEFVVSEAVEPSNDEDATTAAAAQVDGTKVSGIVTDDLAAWRFNSEIERLSVDGNAAVRVNGVEIDPDDIDDTLQNVLLVDGDASGPTRYEFSVDGEVERSNHKGATIDDEDSIDAGTVYGTVADWKDAFRFSGDITELTVDGPGVVSVNGEAIDPADYGTDLPHVLEVKGSGTPTEYEITVDGTIGRRPDDDVTDQTVTVSRSTATGTVTDTTQTFRFSGALTDVTLTDGEASVLLDGTEIDPNKYGDYELLPHALIIDGTQADEPSAYSFRTSGVVVKSNYRNASIDDEDIIKDRTVRATVEDEIDAYWFDGDIDDFTLRGRAAVDVQWNVRS